MNRFTLFLAFSLLAFSAPAQKTIQDPNAVKRTVGGFHAISVSGGIDLYLSYGEESVAVSASESRFRDKIRTEVENGVLKIYYEPNAGRSNFDISWRNRKLKAYVSYKQLDNLIAGGGSDISVDGSIKSSSLGLKISGGSDFDGRVEAGDLKVEASGGSDADISGSARNLELDVSGGSDFKGYELSVDNCSIEASGGSDIYVTVNKEIKASASGGSDIFYKGNGSVKEVRSGGASSIKKISR